MRLRRWHAAGLTALALALSAAPAVAAGVSPSPTPPPTQDPAAGAAPQHEGGVIGGDELGGSGLIVHPLPGAPAIPSIVNSPAWIVADLDTGKVLAARDPHGRFRPASTLKELTALTLIPKIDPNSRITFTSDELAHATYGTHGVSSLAGLMPGTAYKASDLFYAMLLPSGNDAAEALAASYPGGRTAALEAMQAQADHLQAYDTVVKTPDGLDADGQFSSPYDLALIARAGLQLPDFATYVKARRWYLPCKKSSHCTNGKFEIDNHNHVVTSMPGAIGVKNGGTSLARLVVVGAAERNGHRLVAVIMHSEYEPFTQTINLLEWGFAAEGKVTPIGDLVDPVTETAPNPRASGARALAAGPGLAAPKVHAASTSGGGGMPWGWLGVIALLIAAGIVLHRFRAPAPARIAPRPRPSRGEADIALAIPPAEPTSNVVLRPPRPLPQDDFYA
ncbi:MAG TPA: serine hydrolase [Mycobacteriales bacterium]|nr:serine hydrolase [Mycobacteriales bacterium]